MASGKVEQVDVAIIGAGWYGLVAARTYLRLRPSANVLIIDSNNSVGGIWSKDRLYPNLVAQVKLGLFNYSDTPMPPFHGDPNDPRVTSEMIHDYMQKYAEEHDLLRRTRFNTFVSNAEQTSHGWRLSLRDCNEIIEAQKLLVATGVTSIPHMPTFEGVHDPSIPIIHSRDIGTSLESLKDESVKQVVVVGAAKSAYDVVYLMLSLKKKVTWIIRSEGAGPLAILPFKVLNTLNSIAVASTRLMTHLSPSILNVRGLFIGFSKELLSPAFVWGDFGISWIMLVVYMLVTATETMLICSHQKSTVKGKYPSSTSYSTVTTNRTSSVFWAHSGLGVVTLPDFWGTLHSKNLTIIRDEIDTVKDRTVLLKSGSALKADYAVMCTGWGDHFSIFDSAHKSLVGLPKYGKDNLYQQSSADDKSLLGSDSKVDWQSYDQAAERAVNEKLPFLSNPPTLKHTAFLDPNLRKKWRLFRRAMPIELALRGDRSLAILGQIYTVQTPLVSEVQTFWAILYLLGEIGLPDLDTMTKEISLWNAWTRKRYLNQG